MPLCLYIRDYFTVDFSYIPDIAIPVDRSGMPSFGRAPAMSRRCAMRFPTAWASWMRCVRTRIDSARLSMTTPMPSRVNAADRAVAPLMVRPGADRDGEVRRGN